MVNYFRDPQKVSFPQVIRLFMMCAQTFHLKIGFLCCARMQHCNATMVHHLRSKNTPFFSLLCQICFASLFFASIQLHWIFFLFLNWKKCDYKGSKTEFTQHTQMPSNKQQIATELRRRKKMDAKTQYYASEMVNIVCRMLYKRCVQRTKVEVDKSNECRQHCNLLLVTSELNTFCVKQKCNRIISTSISSK